LPQFSSYYLLKEATLRLLPSTLLSIYSRTFVDVTGDLEAGDEKTFMNKVGTPAAPEKVMLR